MLIRISKCKCRKAFTLIEIMFSAGIMVSLLVGLLALYVYCFDIQETSRNTSFVLRRVKAEVEKIRRMDFASIIANYDTEDERIIDLAPDLNGKIYITASYTAGSNNDLIEMRAVGGWAQKGGRIIGEGVFIPQASGVFTFSDLNGNGRYDSPVVIETTIANKTQ